jgi:molybdenum cofactor cytidylyltransferase
MHTSIRSGIEAVEARAPNSDAAILMNCDQPHITPELLRALATEFQKSEPPAVGSQYDGIVGTPALFSRVCFERLKALKGGAKSLLLELGETVKRCVFPDGNIDVDTYADYSRLCQTGKDR